MTHVPSTDIHRYVSDRFVLRIPVEGLEPAQVQAITWICGPIAKALSDGITVDDEDNTAVLVVDITKADTEAIGAGSHEWQAAAGAADPPVVATGNLILDQRLTPPT